jgi:hypothetical protein
MTSVVKVAAHCSDDKEVVVKIFDSKTNEVKEEIVLQNGQSTEKNIYDDLTLATTERLKATDQPDESQEGGDEQAQDGEQSEEQRSGSNASNTLREFREQTEYRGEGQQKQDQ